MSDAEFQEWLAANSSDLAGDPRGVALRAWNAALAVAARTAREQAKRYACAKCKGICGGIADQIKKQEAR